MATDHQGRAEHWRRLEREALTGAIEAADEATKLRFLAVAAVYEPLAVGAETADAAVVPTSLPDGIDR